MKHLHISYKIFSISVITIFSISMLSACSSFSLYKDTQTTSATTKTLPAQKNANKKIAQPKISQTKTQKYIIQPGDILEISVWKEKDLQKEVLVRPDGIVTFPLVGDINAAGLTFSEFKKSLSSKLARYIPKPAVTVSSKQSAGNKIFVIGKVNRPGEYPTNRPIDVMQALALAGGLNPYASERNIKILRRENGVLKAIPFNYKKVKKGKRLEQNIILRGGDIVVVR